MVCVRMASASAAFSSAVLVAVAAPDFFERRRVFFVDLASLSVSASGSASAEESALPVAFLRDRRRRRFFLPPSPSGSSSRDSEGAPSSSEVASPSGSAPESSSLAFRRDFRRVRFFLRAAGFSSSASASEALSPRGSSSSSPGITSTSGESSSSPRLRRRPPREPRRRRFRPPRSSPSSAGASAPSGSAVERRRVLLALGSSPSEPLAFGSALSGAESASAPSGPASEEAAFLRTGFLRTRRFRAGLSAGGPASPESEALGRAPGSIPAPKPPGAPSPVSSGPSQLGKRLERARRTIESTERSLSTGY